MHDDYDPERDGVLLKAGEVMALLHVARSTLPLMRQRGELIGYQRRSGHWAYPSRQTTLAEALAALHGQEATDDRFEVVVQGEQQ